MKLWTQEEEIERLKTRFMGLNRAEFARDHKVPGGSAMIYQHLQGMRPINLDQAVAYARGFKVPLSDISPRLAKQAMDALGVTVPRQTGATTHDPAPDKFSVLHELPENCQDAILTIARTMVQSISAKPARKKKELAHAPN